MKKLLKTLFAGVMLFSVVGCGNNSGSTETAIKTELDNPVEITIWHTWTKQHQAKLQEFAERFNASQDKITVKVEGQPLTDFDSKVLHAVRTNNGPDIIFTTPTVAATYAEDGMIANLGEYIQNEKVGISNFKENLPAATYNEISQWNGNIYMIPIMKTGELFYYNKTLYDTLGLSVPKTWSELESNSRIIKEHTGKAAFGFDSITDGATVLMMQNGSGYFNVEEKKAVFNNEKAEERFQWFGNLVQEGVFRLVGEDQYFSNLFGSEGIASYIGSSAGYKFVEDSTNGKFEIGVAPIPQEGEKQFSSSYGSSAVVFKSNPDKELAAYEFIKYFVQTENNVEWSITYGALPAFNEALNAPNFQEYLAGNKYISALVKQRETVDYIPALKGSNEARIAIGRALEQVATKLKTAKEALTQAAEDTNKAISR
ncbi:MAG: ABC transporter substrate-binding protein [Erysipelotrichaceae bacterium]|nr:ABC transporter substrate-binding protein [Erysipelotrichaceae bacterium]